MATRTLDTQLEQDLERLAQDDTFADAILKGSDGQVAVHLALLDVRCPSLAGEPEYHMGGVGGGEKVIIQVEQATKSTLANFVYFLHTDKLKEGLACSEAMSLMALSQDLAEGQAETGLPVRRLFALCEQFLVTQLDLSNAVEVLVGALSHKLSYVEQSVYELLSRERVDDVAFSARLVEGMIPDHRVKLKYAIAAIGGNANPKGANAQTSACPVPSPRLLSDLTTLLDHARTTEWPGSPQRFVDSGIAGEGEATGCGAHRFMLALRSEYFAAAFRTDMQEGESHMVRLSTQPPPSRKAMEALLSFIYTANWEIDGAEPTDYLDLLSMLGNDYLKLRGYEALESAVSQHVVSLESGGNPWQLLRRATAAGNETVKAVAKRLVLTQCGQLKKDPVALKSSWAAPSEEECPWWSAQDETAMKEDVLLFFSNFSVRTCENADWTLTVENPYPWAEAYDSVYNTSGNRYLKQRDTTCGSATFFGYGAIQATFAEVVYVNAVVVAPLGSSSDCLKRAVLQVKSDTGAWDTVCETLTGEEQRINVQRVGKEWRLHGVGIATSMFIFEP